MRYPLVDGQGNFGSIDGDPPAAMRYTEARMTRIAGEMLADIEQGDRRLRARTTTTRARSRRSCRRGVPNLLVNGSSGIAVGMATNIPPHNLGEIIDALMLLASTTRARRSTTLMEIVPGPDFPTGGDHLRPRRHPRGATAPAAARSPCARRAEVEEARGTRSASSSTEIPYQVNKAR